MISGPPVSIQSQLVPVALLPGDTEEKRVGGGGGGRGGQFTRGRCGPPRYAITSHSLRISSLLRMVKPCCCLR